MEVREEVFVVEQQVPLENEFDSDDARACHWVCPPQIVLTLFTNPPQVVYASINTTTEPQEIDAAGNIVKSQQSVTKSQPIGTIRLVPFPHPPHPEPGSSYAADALETGPNAGSSEPPAYIIDRPTTYHDGKEPYIKLGRIAVLKEFRGAGISKILANAAMTWAQQNPTYFNPSIESMGMDNMGASSTDEIPVWKGLMCVHAQEQVAKAWAKWGFQLDEGMGTWIEEGINHVGMFQRFDIGSQVP
jgi:predicted GNAT family N-acyltransferase